MMQRTKPYMVEGVALHMRLLQRLLLFLLVIPLAAACAPWAKTAPSVVPVGSQTPPGTTDGTKSAGAASDAARAGRQALGHGDYRSAIALLQQAADLTPQDKTLWNDLAFAYIKAGQLQPAAVAVERALALDPKFAPAVFNRGLIYFQSGDFGQAERAFASAHQLEPDRVEPGWYQALSYERLGVPETAVAILEELVQRFPTDTAVQAKLAALTHFVTWPYLQDQPRSSAYTGDLLLMPVGTGLSARKAGGGEAWHATLGEPATYVLPDVSSQHVLVLTSAKAYLFDLMTGKPLGVGPLPDVFQLRGTESHTQVHVAFRHGVLLWGADIAGGPAAQYLFTAWTFSRVAAQPDGSLGFQSMKLGVPDGELRASTMVPQVSQDGQVVLLRSQGGAALLAGGGLVHFRGDANGAGESERFSLTEDGQTIYSLGTSGIVRLYDRNGRMTTSFPAGPEYGTVQEWPGGDGLRLALVPRSGSDTLVKVVGAQGQTLVSATLKDSHDPAVDTGNPKYLLVKHGWAAAELLDTKGNAVGYYAHEVSISPDAKWIYDPVYRDMVKKDGQWLAGEPPRAYPLPPDPLARP